MNDWWQSTYLLCEWCCLEFCQLVTLLRALADTAFDKVGPLMISHFPGQKSVLQDGYVVHTGPKLFCWTFLNGSCVKEVSFFSDRSLLGSISQVAIHFTLRGHLAMSGFWLLQLLRWGGQCSETRETDKHPTFHKTDPPNKELSS